MSLLTTMLTTGTTNANLGTVNTGTSVTTDITDGSRHTTTLSVSTTLPAIAGGAALGVGKLLYTFPAGNIRIHSAYMSLAITQTQAHINADTPDVGLGTTIASGVNSLLSAVGAAAENFVTGQTAANCTGTASTKTVGMNLVIESADDHTLYANAAATWAASGDAAALLTGTVVIEWSFII
jgi:hypothetical protein